MLSLSRKLKLLALLLITLLSGCTLFGVDQVTLFNDYQIYKIPKTEHRAVTNELPERNTYLSKAKPVIDSRCVACDACYGAACQIKMSSPAGIDRCASIDDLYFWDKKSLFESMVICEYIDEITPGSQHPEKSLEEASHRA